MRVPPLVRRVAAWWEVPFLGALGALMFWWRWPSYALNVVGDRVYYMGTDPYYHLRALLVSLEHFPLALRWDPWTFFPRGTYTGQFGTLFDSLLAGVVLLLAGGEPTRLFAERALAVYPAVLGALTVVPTYFVAKRVFGNPGAVWAAVALALVPGSFFSRSVAAHADHHVAETLASTFTVLGLLVTLERARRHEAALAEGWAVHRRDVLVVAGWGALGAFAFAVYFWTWPPATLFVAILAAALVLLVLLDHAKGRSSRATALATGVVFVGAALLVLPVRDTNGFEATFWTWTQPVTLVLGALVVAAAAWGSEALGRRMPGFAYALFLVAVVAVVALVVRVALPEYWRVLAGGFQWVTGIGYEGGGRTIAEAREATTQDMLREYGWLFWGALAGLLAVAWRALADPRPGNVTLLVWSGFMLVAAYNQVRFNYYLAVNVALLNGFLLAEALRLARFEEAWRGTFSPAPKGRRGVRPERLGWKQALALAAVVLFAVPGNALPYEGADECRGGVPYRPAWWVAKCMGPDRDVQVWTDGLLWLRDHTPSAGVDLGARHDPATFRYPPEAYGVLSWWDYGHWTEVLAERAPVANPFQQAAPFASRFFTAQDEAAAEALLEEWSPDLPVRYVLIDDESASTKFYAITVWAGFDAYPARGDVQIPGLGGATVPVLGDAYGRTMMARLYRDGAEGLSHWRLVHEERATTLLGSVLAVRGERIDVPAFNDILDWGSPEGLGGTYGLNYRSEGLVCEGPSQPDGSCPSGRFAYGLQVHSSLKFFEHVRGARVVGEARPNETVTAVLELRAESTGRSWQWEKATTADASGRWEMVLPHPTTGFLTPAEGGTDADVVPRGEWLFALGDARAPRAVLGAHVSERDVLEGREVRAR